MTKYVCRICCSFFLFDSLGLSFSYETFIEKPISKVKRSYSEHPSIPGFEYAYGLSERVLSSSASGYFYYDMDLYYTQFTSVSRLYIIHNTVDFTSGYIAIQNDETGYNDDFDLWSGYLHVAPGYKHWAEGWKNSSTIIYKESWPRSSDFTKVVTSYFSTDYIFRTSIEAGISLSEGLYISATTSSSIVLSFDKDVAVSSPEPTISYQLSPSNPKEGQWFYQYDVPGRATYELDTYYLFEVKDDGLGFQAYSFPFTVDVKMKNIAYQGLPNEQMQSNIETFSHSYGLD